MAEIGQEPPRLVARASSPATFAIASLFVAAAAALWMWPFTIDDALVSVRYARHLADGIGYRFNVGGPSTDGVTPLPWAFLLSPFARGTALAVLAHAKTLGFLVWLATSAAWGAAVGRAESSRAAKLSALVGLGVCVPLAAHAVSGMETALATSLATVAAILHRRPRAAALAAGLAAALRPEMAPWALLLAAQYSLSPPSPSKERVAMSCGAAVVPFVACAVARLAWFGTPAPLAVVAKPSDLWHGLVYVLAAALASVGPLMAFAPLAAARAKGPGRAIVVAATAHLVAVAVAGGDWMPYARLLAPVVPSLLYAAVLLAPVSMPGLVLARSSLSILLGSRVMIFAAPAGRHSGPDREELAVRVAPIIAGLPRIASVDIGWVSAATEADIIDLGGVTDPEIAALGGGQTSKRVDGSLLLAKDPDALILYASAEGLPLERWREAFFPRVIDARLARDDLVDAHFAAAVFTPLGATGYGYYVLLRRR
jgi:hypothetical protein